MNDRFGRNPAFPSIERFGSSAPLTQFFPATILIPQTAVRLSRRFG